MRAGRIIAALAGAGLFAGAAAWAVHQQAGYIISTRLCQSAEPWSAVLTAGVLVLLAGGAAISWLALRRRPQSGRGAADTVRPRRFMATVSLMGAALFGFAIALQASAHLFIAPCVP